MMVINLHSERLACNDSDTIKLQHKFAIHEEYKCCHELGMYNPTASANCRLFEDGLQPFKRQLQFVHQNIMGLTQSEHRACLPFATVVLKWIFVRAPGLRPYYVFIYS